MKEDVDDDEVEVLWRMIMKDCNEIDCVVVVVELSRRGKKK